MAHVRVCCNAINAYVTRYPRRRRLPRAAMTLRSVSFYAPFVPRNAIPRVFVLSYPSPRLLTGPSASHANNGVGNRKMTVECGLRRSTRVLPARVGPSSSHGDTQKKLQSLRYKDTEQPNDFNCRSLLLHGIPYWSRHTISMAQFSFSRVCIVLICTYH